MFKIFTFGDLLSIGLFWDSDEFTLGIGIDESSLIVYAGCIEIMLEIL